MQLVLTMMAPVQVTPYATHRIDPPGTSVKTNKDQLLKFFTAMYRMRRMEIAADMMYKAKYIRGFCHLCAAKHACCCLVFPLHTRTCRNGAHSVLKQHHVNAGSLLG